MYWYYQLRIDGVDAINKEYKHFSTGGSMVGVDLAKTHGTKGFGIECAVIKDEIKIGPGDDAAVIAANHFDLVHSVDIAHEGVHFPKDSLPEQDISAQDEISETQINIDELLVEKEIIQIVDELDLKKIAILLPMTGRYSKIGKAIFQGIELELSNKKNNIPKLTIHDTGDENINLKKVYNEMLDQNYDYIIGPLQKDLISKILKYGSESLPILTLNYLNNFKGLKQGVHQFGLLPEDESICIAEKAIIDGNNNASIFYPDNIWGKRIAESFLSLIHI